MGKDLKGKELGIGLTQRKDGKYSAKLTRFDGKRTEKYFDKLKDAREWLASERFLDSQMKRGDLTVDTWYNIWINTYKEGIVKANTLKNYKIRYLQNIKPEIGNVMLQSIRQVQCQKILNDMHWKGYASGTIELTKITLHALFDGAVTNQYISHNPAKGLKIKIKDDKKEQRVLNAKEEKVFKHYIKDTLYENAYLLVLQTGLRVGEIGGLQWGDIDFDKKILHVQRTLLQEKAKGGFYFGTPKTPTSKRVIPLTDEAINILKEQYLKQKKLKFKNQIKWNNKWGDLVFTTINGNPVGDSTFRKLLIGIVHNINTDIECGMIECEEFAHIYMHSLRHTFATRCIEKGVTPKVLQKILGHSTLSTTMDLYVHVSDDLKHEEIAKLNSEDQENQDLSVVNGVVKRQIV